MCFLYISYFYFFINWLLSINSYLNYSTFKILLWKYSSQSITESLNMLFVGVAVSCMQNAYRMEHKRTFLSSWILEWTHKETEQAIWRVYRKTLCIEWSTNIKNSRLRCSQSFQRTEIMIVASSRYLLAPLTWAIPEVHLWQVTKFWSSWLLSSKKARQKGDI